MWSLLVSDDTQGKYLSSSFPVCFNVRRHVFVSISTSYGRFLQKYFRIIYPIWLSLLCSRCPVRLIQHDTHGVSVLILLFVKKGLTNPVSISNVYIGRNHMEKPWHKSAYTARYISVRFANIRIRKSEFGSRSHLIKRW